MKTIYVFLRSVVIITFLVGSISFFAWRTLVVYGYGIPFSAQRCAEFQATILSSDTVFAGCFTVPLSGAEYARWLGETHVDVIGRSADGRWIAESYFVPLLSGDLQFVEIEGHSRVKIWVTRDPYGLSGVPNYAFHQVNRLTRKVGLDLFDIFFQGKQ